MILVLFVHADPSIHARYLEQLKGRDVELRAVNRGARSSAYTKLAHELRQRDSRGTLLEKVCRYAGASSPASYERVVVFTYSAGYALARELLAEPESAAQIDGLGACDSIHAGYDPDGTARDSQLAGFVRYGMRAKLGEVAMWVGHSDVRTPPLGHPQGFASTTSVAHELARFLEMDRAERNDRVVDGKMVLGSFDVRKSDTAEHIAALVEWGPAWMAGLVRDTLSLPPPPPPAPPPPVTSPLGVRAYIRSLSYLGVSESTKRGRELIESWHRAVGGGWLTYRNPWCASHASAVALEVMLPGEELPHDPSFRVREVWASAIRKRRAVGISEVRRHPSKWLRQGHLLIMSRGALPRGEGANAFGPGHVGRIEDARDLEDIATVDGNKGDEVTRFAYSLDDSHLVGVVPYPDGDRLDEWDPTDEELTHLGQLEEQAATRRRGA